jgi:hypothetical protein
MNTMNTCAASLSDEQREQLHLIERCDPSLLIHHIEEDTAYDGPLVARVFELAKERARSLLATPATQADAAPTGAMTRTQVQGKAIEYGFQYWRAPDAHGVTGTKPQAIEFLQDLLGVEVEIEDNGCQTCNGTGMIGGPSYYAPDEGGEPCPDCAAIAAGGAQEVDVFEWLETELSAISCRYHGDPSYDHDAYWMKDRVMKLIADARKAFPLPRVAATAWQPIETAPLGAKGYCWMNLAWGPEGDVSTGVGMRWGDRFFAAGSFYCLGQEKRYEFREIEVKPTHWMPLPAAPAAASNGEQA